MPENFNYISFGNWDYVESITDMVEMNRGRMFEYTPTDIAERLEGLLPTSLTFLEQLPTFICSEIGRRDGAIGMLVKYGRIENIKPGQKEVAATFNIKIDFGRIEFSSIEEALALFGADKFQVYRTHWAVREGDVQEILAKLAKLKPELIKTVEAQLAQISEVAEPPARLKETIGVASTVEEFLQCLYGITAQDASPKGAIETFFRGHEDAQFELTPSLLRKLPKSGAWRFLPNEDRLCKELLIAHYDEFHADQYCFDRLVRMQHYGLPTRLLDISGNPLIALFFACSGTAGVPDIDGEVIVFQVASEKVKYYDSDTVSCLANLSNLTHDQKNRIDLKLDVDAFNETEVAEKLLHHIKSEKGFFQPRIVPDDLGSIVCVKAKQTNTRIKSQLGAFLLFGHEAALPKSGQEGMKISRITIKNKLGILRQLDSLNINATTVYPSIERTTVHLAKRYEVDSLD